jgi:hypothetical protein
MMTIQVKLKDESSRELMARAATVGKDVSAYIEDLVERDLHPPTYAEIFKPIQEACAGHGMSEEELNEFLLGELRAAREERHQREGR